MPRIRFCLLHGFLLTALLMLGIAPSASADDEPQLLQPMDVFQLEFASDPQVSPDGSQVAYLRNSMNVMRDRVVQQLWVVNADGSDHRPMIDSQTNVSQPRWSPDGKRVAYVAKGEEGPAQLFVRWLETGQTAQLSQLEEAPSDLTWSSDGQHLAYVMLVPNKVKPFIEMPEKPEGAKWADAPKIIRESLYRHDGEGYLTSGFRHVFVISADGGTPRQLTSGNFHHNGPLSWTPDGKQIYCSGNRQENWDLDPRESNIFAIGVADGSLKQLTDRKGPDQNPIVSPDGTKLAWVGYDDQKLSHQTTQLYVMDLDGGKPRVVTGNFDRDVASPVWNGDSQTVLFQYDDQGTTKLGLVAIAGNKAGQVVTLADNIGGVTIGRPYASGSFSAAANGTFAFTLVSPDHPADVALGQAPQSHIARLTNLNEDLFAQRTLAKTEEFRYTASVDKREIQSWIVRPPGFDPSRKYPLILEIHGGPFANYGNRFSTEIQYYAAAGYVVLYVNPRGSTGYGQEFANLIHHKYPAQDYDDLMAGVDAVIAQGYVDPNRLYVTGGSGGGILTAWIVGQTGRFRAAVSAKPVINWYSFALTTDVYPYFTQYWFPGPPWEHVEQYLQRSPISNVQNVTTPTMLITGEQDHRTPITEAEQFYQALKLRGVDTMLVRVPDSSHNIVARPSRLIMKVKYVLKWFSMYP